MDSRYVEILKDYINILQSWRQKLWDSASKSTIVIYLPLIEGICDIKNQLASFQNLVPSNIYLQFDKEYTKTMYLLHKCVLRVQNRNFPLNQEQAMAMEQIKIKLSKVIGEDIDYSSIVSELNIEYLNTLRKSLGLSDNIIQAFMQKGISVDNVLNEVSKSNLKR